ncbi:hypothetical protein BNJ_00082 [Kaumoebavirus]|uniref:hypothetical protein n=1 Tax=Kaumoebavirus TaxID=1859492 RepID=UPI0009C32827|nr:hypothetical protein BNJ_00082 [Kaumoebavirus]ARA71922.1 hypothetical protein BNJ_00082 [Kaumoebavirus]
MADDADYDVEDDNKKGDFISMVADGIQSIPYKVSIFLFIIYLFLVSEIFVGKFLTRFNGAVDELKNVTLYGDVVRGIILVLFFLLFSLLVNFEVV